MSGRGRGDGRVDSWWETRERPQSAGISYREGSARGCAGRLSLRSKRLFLGLLAVGLLPRSIYRVVRHRDAQRNIWIVSHMPVGCASGISSLAASGECYGCFIAETLDSHRTFE